ncbi:MAG: methyltransferase domain-containing protein [Betaproteobacteria bacterium]|nr:methyltransferase domain-containing protein [Betaproteobacteria bacterium]
MQMTHAFLHRLGGSMLVLSLIVGCASEPPRLSAGERQAILDAPDRTEADRANDGRRKAPQLLAFIDARPGMRVLDLGAGGGYTTELLARSVGPNGHVYAQNTEYFVKNLLRGRFDARLKSPAMRNVTHHVAEFDDPVPKDVRPASIDLVTFMFTYHDTGWTGADRARMNKAVFDALKRGGHYVVADHSGRPGTGISESKSLHRVEEALVRKEVEAAGFKLIDAAGFLRNPEDPRDRIVFKPAQPNDEFVLKFVKP